MRQPPAWLCATALALAFVSLATLTWGALADPVIDFGQQVYAPWQVAQGQVLYRDLAWFLGPLSVHFHAAVFFVTGPSLVALNLLNLLLLAAFLGGLLVSLSWLADRAAALAACLFVLATFGFGHLSDQGNYALAAPYAHEATHGLYLVALSLLALGARLHTGRRVWTGCVGAAVGAAFLTKPEMFLAATGSVVIGGLAAWFRPPDTGRPDRGDALAFAAGSGCVLGPAVCALALRQGSLLQGLGDAAGAWRHLRSVGGSAFYGMSAGLDQPLDHLGRLLLAGGLVGGLILAARWAAARSERTQGLVLVALVFLGAGVAARWPALLPRAILPGTAALVVLLARAIAQTDDPRERARLGTSLAAASAAAILLAKQGLFPKVHHYGFVLTLPAAVCAVTAVVHALPARAEAAGLNGAFCRKLALFLIAFLTAVFLKTTLGNVFARDHSLAPGLRVRSAAPDGSPLGPVLSETLTALRATPPDARCLVLPEGILLNVLARRPTPTRFTKHMPHELAAFGPDAALRALQASPPTLVVLMHRDLTEFGAQPFGQNPFDRALLNWVRARYPRVEVLGAGFDAPPHGFGVEMRRSTP